MRDYEVIRRLMPWALWPRFALDFRR
jgi:hypothetical protein